MSEKAANKRGDGWQPNVADHLYAAPAAHLAKLPMRAGLVIFGQSAWWLERSLVQ